MKKILSMILALSMLLSLVTVPVSAVEVTSGDVEATQSDPEEGVPAAAEEISQEETAEPVETEEAAPMTLDTAVNALADKSVTLSIEPSAEALLLEEGGVYVTYTLFLQTDDATPIQACAFHLKASAADAATLQNMTLATDNKEAAGQSGHDEKLYYSPNTAVLQVVNPDGEDSYGHPYNLLNYTPASGYFAMAGYDKNGSGVANSKTEIMTITAKFTGAGTYTLGAEDLIAGNGDAPDSVTQKFGNVTVVPATVNVYAPHVVASFTDTLEENGITEDDTFTVDLVQNVAAIEGQFSTTLKYDSALLEVVTNETSAVSGYTMDTATAGQVTLTRDGGSCGQGDTLGTVTFKALKPKNAEGEAVQMKETALSLTETWGDISASGTAAEFAVNLKRCLAITAKSGDTMLTSGESQTLAYDVVGYDGELSNVTWTVTSGGDYASVDKVDKSGKLTAKTVSEPCKVTVTVSAKMADGEDIIGTETFTVLPKVEHVQILRNEEDVTGQTVTYDLNGAEDALSFAVKLQPAGVKEDGFVWTINNVEKGSEDTFTVEKTDLNIGKNTVSVKDSASGMTATVTLNVVKYAKAVTIVAPDDEVTAGKTLKLTAYLDKPDGSDASDSTLTDKNIVWSISGDGVAWAKMSNGTLTVDKTLPTVTDVTVTAAAKCGNAATTKKITLCPAVESLQVWYAGDEVTGQTIVYDINTESGFSALRASVLPAGAAEGDFTWKVSGPLTVSADGSGLSLTTDAKTGLPKTGTATLTVTDKNSGKSATVKINVVKYATEVTIADVPEEGFEVTAGKTLKLTAYLDKPDGSDASDSTLTDKNIVWTISGPGTPWVKMSNGTLSVDKTLTAQTFVEVTAAAKCGNAEPASVNVTLCPALDSIWILDDGGNNVSGQTVTYDLNSGADAPGFLAQRQPSGAHCDFTWTLPATVTADGAVTGAKANTVSGVAATGTDFGGKTGTYTLTVKDSLSGKSATVKVNVVRWAQTVEIASFTNVNTQEVNTLHSGDKAVVLSAAAAGTGDVNTAVVWSLKNAADKAYLSLSGNKITAATVYSEHDVVVVATAKDGSGKSAEITVKVKPNTSTQDTTLMLLRGSEDVTKQTLSYALNGSESKTFSAKFVDNSSASDVTWKSSNTKVATVNTNGEVTLLNTGKADITASVGKISAKVTLNVVNPVTELTVTTRGNAPAVAGAGKSLTLIATPNTNATNKTVTWAITQGGEYATVSAKGVLTVNKTLAKTQTVTVQAAAMDGSGVVGTIGVTVAPLCTGVTIYRGEEAVRTLTQDIKAEKTIKLSALTEPTAASDEVVWSTSSAKIATVEDDGTVTLLNTGKVTITAAAADGSGKKTAVTITAVALTDSITISAKDNATDVAAGKALNLLAAVLTSDEELPTNQNITWTITEGAKYATIKGAKGGATLTAAKGITAQQTVKVKATAADGNEVTSNELTFTVHPLVTSMAIRESGEVKIAMTVDFTNVKSLSLSATTYPADAADTVIWKSSSAKIATVEDDGTVTLSAPGKVTITATAADGSGKKATLTITVIKTMTADDIAFTPAAGNALSLEKGKSITFKAAINKSVTNKNLVWSISGDTAYATISKGTLKAKSNFTTQKSVTVTATAADGSGVTASWTVTLNP